MDHFNFPDLKLPDIRIPSTSENFIEVIKERVQKLEANVKAGETLIVYCDIGFEVYGPVVLSSRNAMW